MEWNPVLERRLAQSKKSAGWRWIGYIGVVFGLLAAVAGWVGYIEDKSACEQAAGAFEECEGPSIGLYIGPGAAIFVLGLIVAMPAEKAAKEAKELRIQKEAARSVQGNPAPTGQSSCTNCSAVIASGSRFCSQCGQATG